MIEPTIGRVVHYWPAEGERYLNPSMDTPLPAMVMRIHGGPLCAIDLMVFTRNMSGLMTLRTNSSYGTSNGGWSWPEGTREHGLIGTKETVDHFKLDATLATAAEQAKINDEHAKVKKAPHIPPGD